MAQDPYAATAVPDPYAATAISAPPPPPTSKHPYLDAATDFGKGLGKGVVNTMSMADDFAQKHLPAFMTTPIGQAATPENSARAVQAAKDLATPHNTMQSIGKGVEQAGEFLLPTGIEKGAAALGGAALGKGGALAGKYLGSALHTGAINKAQGGDFTTGAAAGAIGTGIGQGLKAVAPSIAESSLGMRFSSRLHGKTPGQAMLDETKGIRPATVKKSAEDAISRFTNDLYTRAGASQEPFSMAPARLTLKDALDKGIEQNSPTLNRDLVQASDQLHFRVDPSNPAKLNFQDPIPTQVTPMQGLQFKQGLNHLVNNWDKSGGSPAAGTLKSTYGALDSELDRTVPGADELNQKISSLLPVVDRANIVEHGSPTTQTMLHRMAVPTGAMAAPLGMGAYGYEHGGVAGAAKGFAEGMALPLLVSSPTGQMALARTLNSGVLSKGVIPFLKGSGLQLNRSDEEDKKK